jgi:hypothetical protein
MKSPNKKLSDKEIKETYKKLGLGDKSEQDGVQEWIEKSVDSEDKEKEKPLWIISDDTTSFINFNNNYGELETNP